MRTGLMVFFLGILSLTAAEDQVWISVDRKEALSIQAAMAKDYGVQLRWHAFVDQHIAIGQISNQELHLLSDYMHQAHRRCGGFFQHDSFEAARLLGDKLLHQASQRARLGSAYVIDNPSGAALLEAQVEEANILDFITEFSAFDNRFYNSSEGVAAAEWLRDHWQTLTETRSDVSVNLVTHSFPQPSVVARFTGTVTPDEVVVVGGHLDSTSFQQGPQPGADDNASGIGCLTELIRALVATDFRPSKTVEFIGYAAEERGLLGSQDIASDYAAAGTNVVAVMQLDMTNFNGSNEDIWFLSDFTNEDLTSFVEQLIDTYLPDLRRSRTACGYGCSDHASWHAEGYPAVMPFEARFGDHNSAIHTRNDNLAQSNNTATHAAKFARVAAVYLAETAKGGAFVREPERRVRVDMRALLQVINSYGDCGVAACETDLVEDGLVNTGDLYHLIQDWRREVCLRFGKGSPCLQL